jgi:hypothetical protein
MKWLKWLTAVLVLLLFGLAAFPATVGAVGAWISHRSETVQSIDYISHHDGVGASRHYGSVKHRLYPDPGPFDQR